MTCCCNEQLHCPGEGLGNALEKGYRCPVEGLGNALEKGLSDLKQIQTYKNSSSEFCNSSAESLVVYAVHLITSTSLVM